MEKVKLFRCRFESFGDYDHKATAKLFAKDINDWIKSTPGIQISQMTLDASANKFLGDAEALISIFYDVAPTYHKERTRIKEFCNFTSSPRSREILEKEYESWLANQKKKLVKQLAPGIKIATEFEIKSILHTLFPNGSCLMLFVVYTDCSDSDEEPKIKKGPPPPIVLPRREE